jgi:membrane-associated phospholipid phosphatase
MNSAKTKSAAARQQTKPVEPPAVEALAPSDHRVWYMGLLIAGSVLLLAAAFFAYRRTMPGWEQQLFHAVNSVHAPGWVASQIAKPLSNAVWGLVALVGVALFFPRFRWRAWQYMAAIGSAFVVEVGIEQLINRPRPALLLHDAVLRAQQGGPGFPSGHETALAALVLSMWFFVAWPWRILLVALLAAEAWARVFLGVHAPLDVVGGLAVGMVIVGALHLLPKSWRALFRLA